MSLRPVSPQRKGLSKFFYTDYQLVAKRLPFLLFCFCLTLCYITLVHFNENTARDIITKGRQVQELEYEYKVLKSQWMYQSRQTMIEDRVAIYGLKAIAQPPFLLLAKVGK